MQTAEYSMPTSPSDQLGIGDKLAFLACYSRYYLSITAGNHGQLFNLLSQELEGIAPIARLGMEEVRKYDLPILIASGFGLREASPGSGVVFDSLGTLVKTSSVRPLVAIDDAHLITESKLRQLLTLSERFGLGLALFGGKSLARRKACTQFENRIFHTTISKLAESDVRHLVRRRTHADSHFSDVDIDQLVERSDGQMDKLDGLIEDMIELPQRRLGLPLVHMSALIVLGVVMAGGWMSIDSGEVIATEAVSLPVTSIQTQQSIAQSLELRNVGLFSDPAVVVKSEMRGRAQERVSQIGAERGRLVDGAATIIEQDLGAFEASPVTAANSLPPTVTPIPTLIASADPNAWVNELPPSAVGTPVAQSEVAQSIWLQDAPKTAYTLQLMGSHSEERVLSFIAEQGSRGEFGYFKTRHRNQPWFVLTLGQYRNRDLALRAIELLPPSLRAQKPWARSVASIRES